MAPTDKNAILKQFRDVLVQRDLIHDGDTIGTDDETLLRFLRARQFNLQQSTIMWENCQRWRKTVEGVGIDALYREIDPFDYPERDIVFDCWPLYFHKLDKKGRPLNFHHFGGINLNKLQQHVSLERFWRTILVNGEALTREILPAASEAAGKHIPGTFVVADVAGFGIGQFWHMKGFARSAFQLSQDYFPEASVSLLVRTGCDLIAHNSILIRMAHLAIVNAPMGFSTIWNAIKPWLAKETVAKVSIHGSDFRQSLLELIDEDALPASLGGKCTCEGLGGCMKSNAGPWMHEHKLRREAWLRGERPTIALLPGELQGHIRIGRPEEGRNSEEIAGTGQTEAGSDAEPQTETKRERTSEQGPEAVQAKRAPGDTPEVSSTERSPASGSTSETSSLATPASEASQPEREQQAKSREASVEVYEQHPETRVVQTGDLHSESTILTG
ncbi:CRAL/TRIO domain-containing protein [Trametes punicea]|nr:CRAL/TRIO domain-containing protein [Trametes punicea]